jgi:hypothetical protein
MPARPWKSRAQRAHFEKELEPGKPLPEWFTMKDAASGDLEKLPNRLGKPQPRLRTKPKAAVGS